MREGAAAVLAIDGGNSKTDVALVAADGRLLAVIRGPTISHQAVGLGPGMATLRALVTEATRRAGTADAEPAVADIAVGCLAGADYPSDVRLLRRAIERQGFATRTLVFNDTFAALRAGTHRPWGVALICGQGINGAAVAPDGRTARFDGLGPISGDWGGGGAVGEAALGAAVRAQDGRGRRTQLARLVPAHFGLRSPAAVTRAIYQGRIAESSVSELSPLVFEAAGAGDAVARDIVWRLADELAAMASALIRRLRMRRADVEVVLAGGLFRADDPPFYERIEAGIQAVAPAARLVRLTAPPVLGAALVGLDHLPPRAAASPAAETRIRAALEGWRPD